MIRLLLRHRSDVTTGPTATCGPEELSRGKNTRLPTAAAPNTVLPRLDIGRHVPWHAHPDKPACAGVHFRSVLWFAPSFHPTPPHGLAPQPGAPGQDVGAAAVHVRFPPVGVRGGLPPPVLRPCPAHQGASRLLRFATALRVTRLPLRLVGRYAGKEDLPGLCQAACGKLHAKTDLSPLPKYLTLRVFKLGKLFEGQIFNSSRTVPKKAGSSHQ